MVTNLEEFIDFCVRETMLYVRDMPCVEISSSGNTIIRGIVKKYNIPLSVASKSFSPIFWCLTLRHYEEYEPKDGLIHPSRCQRLKYEPPIEHDPKEGWRITKDYRFFDQSALDRLSAQTLAAYGDYLKQLICEKTL